MSLFGSLSTGVMALNAQSQAMTTISNNIANTQTTGYKRSTVAFANLVTGLSTESVLLPGGVRGAEVSEITKQGLLEQTAADTDLGILGRGFFIVSDRQANDQTFPVYTRAGQFREDEDGILVNAQGYTLYGWRLDADGNIPNNFDDINILEPIDTNLIPGFAAPTTTITGAINFDAGQIVDPSVNIPHFSRIITVYDSLGTSHTANMMVTKAPLPAANEWFVDVTRSDGTSLITGDPVDYSATPPDATNSATFIFDPQGNLASITPPGGVADPLLTSLTLNAGAGGIDWGNGSDTTQTITFDVGRFSQLNAPYLTTEVKQNGSAFGERQTVDIEPDGTVNVIFTNGEIVPLYKIPLADFPNADQLTISSQNIFRPNSATGEPLIREPLTASAGQIFQKSLERSNVDIAQEFSALIVTQRAYSAGTKVINTTDQMLQELMQIR